MKIASVAKIKSQFSAFLIASEAGPVVVTRNGRAVAVIVGVQDDETEEVRDGNENDRAPVTRLAVYSYFFPNSRKQYSCVSVRK